MRRALERFDLDRDVVDALVASNKPFYRPGRWTASEDYVRLNNTLDLLGGTVAASRPHNLDDPVPSTEVERFIEAIPAMADYTLPSRSAKVNLASLMTSTDGFLDPGEPPGLQSAVERLSALMPHTAAPNVFVRGYPTRREICQEILRMSPTSNAGWPYCLDGLPKREYALENASDLCALVQARVVALDAIDERALLKCDPKVLWDAGLIDPHLAIEKMEPLKKSKIGRQRVVVCGSVATEAFHRVFDSRGNEAMIDDWGNCPSLIGIGFDDDSVARTHNAMALLAEEAGTTRLADNDATGFEFSRKQWHLVADASVRSLRYGLDLGSRAHRLYVKTAILESRKVYVMHDGTVVVQSKKGYGIQGSGTYRTSCTNTCTRILDAFAIGAPSARAAGDDCVEAWVDDAVRKYWDICGMVVKDYKEASPDAFELCSHQYRSGSPPIPLRAAKSFYKQAAFGFNDPSALQQVLVQFRHAPEWGPFVRTLGRCPGPAAN